MSRPELLSFNQTAELDELRKELEATKRALAFQLFIMALSRNPRTHSLSQFQSDLDSAKTQTLLNMYSSFLPLGASNVSPEEMNAMLEVVKCENAMLREKLAWLEAAGNANHQIEIDKLFPALKEEVAALKRENARKDDRISEQNNALNRFMVEVETLKEQIEKSKSAVTSSPAASFAAAVPLPNNRSRLCNDPYAHGGVDSVYALQRHIADCGLPRPL